MECPSGRECWEQGGGVVKEEAEKVGKGGEV